MTKDLLKNQVFDKLKKLSPSIQDEVVLKFGASEAHLRRDTQSTLAHDLVRVAEQRENGLQALDAIIAQVLKSHPLTQPTYSLPALTLLLGLIGGSILWYSQIPADLTLEIQQASHLADVGLYDEAEQAYQNLLAKQPKHRAVQAQADKLRSMLALFEGDTFNAPLAQQRFEQLLKRFPDDPQILALMGHTQLRTQQAAAAQQTYQRALTHTPQHPDSLFGLGNIYLQQENYAQAKTLFQQALQQAPQHVLYLLNLGFVLIQQNQFKQGIQYYQQVQQLEPDYLPVYLDIAEAYRQHGEEQQARRWFIKLAELMEKPELQNLAKNQDAWWLGGERYLYAWAHKRDYVRHAAGLGQGHSL